MLVSKQLPRVEQNGNRAFVNEADAHTRSEDSRFNCQSFSAHEVDDAVEQWLCFGSGGRIDKAWPSAFTGIAVQGELRHREYSPANLGKAEIHRAGIIIKYTQAGYFGSNGLGIRFRIVARDPDEGQHSPLNCPVYLALDLDRGA